MAKRIVLLPGDGIGPEIMAAARELLEAVGERAGGDRPGPMSAAITAVAVGGAVAVTVYRVLRS